MTSTRATPSGGDPLTAPSASLRHRITRRRVVPWVWLHIPVIDPYTERLRRAAFGEHLCGHQLFVLPL